MKSTKPRNFSRDAVIHAGPALKCISSVSGLPDKRGRRPQGVASRTSHAEPALSERDQGASFADARRSRRGGHASLMNPVIGLRWRAPLRRRRGAGPTRSCARPFVYPRRATGADEAAPSRRVPYGDLMQASRCRRPRRGRDGTLGPAPAALPSSAALAGLIQRGADRG